jgi:hypothetical protein
MKNKKKLYAIALIHKVLILVSIPISPEAPAFYDKSSPPVKQYPNSMNFDSNTFFIN